jgi:hypothetical protein
MAEAEGEGKRKKISDLAGTWDISEEEVETIKKSIKDGWRRWKIHRQYCDYA